MPTMRNSAIPAEGVNGILYVVGGSCCNPGHGSTILATVDAYDPTTNTWTKKAPMPTPRLYHSLGVIDQILYAVGGDGEQGLVSAVEAYDPATNRWTAKTPMPTARFLHAVGVANGLLYVVGGISRIRDESQQPAAPSMDGGGLKIQYPLDLMAFKP